jgi:hypothetical protein
MGRPRHLRNASLAVAWALVGVLGGHLLTYAVLYPEAHLHDAAMVHSGHAWMSLLLPAVATAIAVVLLLGLLGGAGHAASRGVRFTTLVLLQVALFSALEIAERLGDGLALAQLPHALLQHDLGPVLLLGALIQVFTAWLGSTVSRLVAGLGRRVRPAAPRRRLAHPRLLPVVAVRPVARPAGAHHSRGPPILAAFAVPIP